MSTRSLNKVMLIGNLTRDPELRYTPQGTAVCTMGLATNRSWTTESGEKREETEFHRIVAWNKLAELCSQLLFKGRRVYVEGRLSTRSWTGTDGAQRQATEVVIDDMVILDNKRADEIYGGGEGEGGNGGSSVPVIDPSSVNDNSNVVSASNTKSSASMAKKTGAKGKDENAESVAEVAANAEDVAADDIPF